MTEFFKELNRLRTDKAPAGGTGRSQAFHRRDLCACRSKALANPAAMPSTQKRYGLPADYWDTYPEKIAAVTADDVLRIAKKYINPENAQIVAVGDASQDKADHGEVRPGNGVRYQR